MLSCYNFLESTIHLSFPVFFFYTYSLSTKRQFSISSVFKIIVSFSCHVAKELNTEINSRKNTFRKKKNLTYKRHKKDIKKWISGCFKVNEAYPQILKWIKKRKLAVSLKNEFWSRSSHCWQIEISRFLGTVVGNVLFLFIVLQLVFGI